MADLKISELPLLDGTAVAADDEIAIVDESASETKKIKAEAFAKANVRLLPNASIPFSKIDGASLTVPNGSITTVKLADEAVTTSKIENGAVTDAKITGPISPGKLGNQVANVVLAGPSTGGIAAPSFRPLVAADLPKATSVSLGAVSIDVASGLAVNGTGAVSLSTTVTPGTSPVVTYNAYGRVTAGRALTSADLPLATTSQVGAIKVGAGLTVDLDGKLAVDGTVGGGTAGGIVTINGTAPVIVAGTGDTRSVSVDDGTVNSKGVVQLANTAALAAGTAGLVVTADQLKATNDVVSGHTTSITTIQGQVTTINGKVADATTTAKGIVQLADGAAVTAGTAGRAVTADQLKTTNDVVAGHTTSIAGNTTNITTIQGQITTLQGQVVDATTAAKGVVRLADAAAVTAGTTGRAVTADQLKTTNDVVAGHTTSINSNTTNITTIQGQITTLQGQVVDATTAVKGVVRLADGAAITAGTAGRAVTADQLKTTNDTVAGHTTSITTIQGQVTTLNGKVVDATTAVKGIVRLADGAAVAAGTAGLVVTADQLKATNDAITTASGGGLTGLNGTAPINVSGTGAVRTIGVSDATTAATGVARLADAAAVTAGTADRVVTADQLKTTNDVVAGHTTSIANNTTSITTIQGQITTIQGQVVDATTAVKGVVRLADAAAVTAGTAGRAVTADQLKTTNDAVASNTTSITTLNGKTVDATTAIKGIVQLADGAAITAGTAGRAVTADQLKTTNDTVAGHTASIANNTANITAITTSIATNTNNITTIQGQITTINGKVVDASTTAKGIVQLATAAEVTTGTDALKAVTPATAKVELDKKAPLASPTFTGVPSGPTAAAGTNTTQLATTAFAQTYFLAKDISQLPLLP